MLDTITRLLGRIDSGAYDPVAILVELLLIGISVNWCASVLQGTRGTRLLRGALVLLVAVTLIVRVLSVQMGWTRLELLYRYFVVGLAFIALVAFQPELRRALMRAGGLPFPRRGAPRSNVIAALVESAGYLSRKHYGALIAIQREVGLVSWAENGTSIGAEVSANLLNTIFFPNSPLHDLGVIIQADRVVAANCQFPTAESGEVDSALGSRHRAGVGLSEETDAVVLVVSEETGTISLAEGGRLTRFLTLDDLEQELTSRLGGGAQSRSRFRSLTSSELWRIARRALAVVPLTLLIWYLADQASQIEATGIKVELAIATPSANVTVDVERPQPPVFSVHFRGTTRAIERLRADSAERILKVDWSLPSAYSQPNRYSVPALELLENLPGIRSRGVHVLQVSPEQLSIRADRLVSHEMPVRADAGALRIESVTFEPPSVQVWMRADDLERISEEHRFVTARLESRLAAAAPGKTKTLTNVPLEIGIGNFNVVRLEPGTVDAAVTIAGQNIRKRLSNVAVQLAVSPQFWQRYDVELRDVNEWLIELEVEGTRSIVENLKPQDVSASVPLSSEMATTTSEFRSVAVVIRTPEGVTLLGPPRLVQLRVVPRETSQP